MEKLSDQGIRSLAPLRRAASGAVAGFTACLSITWMERVVHLLRPLDNMGLVTLDASVAGVWAFLSLLLFTTIVNPKVRFAILAVLPLLFLALVIWMNPLARGGTGAVGILMPTLVVVLTIGSITSFLGDRLNAVWSENAEG